MNRNKFCIANWKMNLKSSDIIKYLNLWIDKKLTHDFIKVVFCPSFTSMSISGEIIKGTNVSIGGQNVHYHTSGSFTGEVSCEMLKECGCKYVIIGHSERRHILLESDEFINNKIKKVINDKLIPIICIGENLNQRNENLTEKIINIQLESAFSGIPKVLEEKFIIAYEPVWAIGTGKSASLDEIRCAHKIIRKKINQFGFNGKKVSILYGGSVSVNNSLDINKIEDVDGFLIGTSSLKFKDFYSIYQSMQ